MVDRWPAGSVAEITTGGSRRSPVASSGATSSTGSRSTSGSARTSPSSARTETTLRGRCPGRASLVDPELLLRRPSLRRLDEDRPDVAVDEPPADGERLVLAVRRDRDDRADAPVLGERGELALDRRCGDRGHSPGEVASDDRGRVPDALLG